MICLACVIGYLKWKNKCKRIKLYVRSAYLNPEDLWYSTDFDFSFFIFKMRKYDCL